MSNAITWWNFSITTLPTPPKGINQGSLPPQPQTLASTKVLRVDTGSLDYALWVVSLGLPTSSEPVVKDTLKAIEDGNFVVANYPWPDAIALVKQQQPSAPALPTKSVTLKAQSNWVQIFEIYNQGGDSTHQLDVTLGVTSSEEDNYSFGAEVGVSVEAGFSVASVTASASFTASLGHTVSVSLSKETSQSTQFSLPANAFVQIWQLQMSLVADDGSAIVEAVESYQSLSTTKATAQALAPA